MATSTADGKDETGAPIEPSQEKGAEKSSSTRSSVKGQPSPRLPHERDESSDSGTGAPREIMKQAAADIENGLVATDRSEQTDELYARTLRGHVDAPANTAPDVHSTKTRKPK